MWGRVLAGLTAFVVGWPWRGELEMEAAVKADSVNLTTEETTPEPIETIDPEGIFWWIEGTVWGFWKPAGLAGSEAPWFGTPDQPGRLRMDGGWAGYFIDGIGVQAFGSWWPWTACIIMASFNIGLLGILTYSLHTLTGPCRAIGRGIQALCGLCCCKRRDELDAHLPSARPPTVDIEWHGPKTGWPTETRYLQQRLKGRGSRRRLNDVVI